MLPLLLQTNFRNGFTGRGICKAFDLVSGLPTNTDMPWWSLPETMRAATAVHALAPPGTAGDTQRTHADGVLSACHGVFAANFLRFDLPIGRGGGMAFQTLQVHKQSTAIFFFFWPDLKCRMCLQGRPDSSAAGCDTCDL